MAAEIPISAWVGRSPTSIVGIAIIITDRVSAFLRPMRSPICPKRTAPHRSHQEAGGEGTEGGDQRGAGVCGGKEEFADGGCKEAVDGEVVPFENVPDESGREHARFFACGCLCIDFLCHSRHERFTFCIGVAAIAFSNQEFQTL